VDGVLVHTSAETALCDQSGRRSATVAEGKARRCWSSQLLGAASVEESGLGSMASQPLTVKPVEVVVGPRLRTEE
jgi:hypothetical protein